MVGVAFAGHFDLVRRLLGLLLQLGNLPRDIDQITEEERGQISDLVGSDDPARAAAPERTLTLANPALDHFRVTVGWCQALRTPEAVFAVKLLLCVVTELEPSGLLLLPP